MVAVRGSQPARRDVARSRGAKRPTSGTSLCPREVKCQRSTRLRRNESSRNSQPGDFHCSRTRENWPNPRFGRNVNRWPLTDVSVLTHGETDGRRWLSTPRKVGILRPQSRFVARIQVYAGLRPGESRFRNLVEMRTLLGQVRLPTTGRPQLQVVLNPNQHHLFLQLRQTGQFLGNADPPLYVDLHPLGLGVEQACETADLLFGRRRFTQSFSQSSEREKVPVSSIGSPHVPTRPH